MSEKTRNGRKRKWQNVDVDAITDLFKQKWKDDEKWQWHEIKEAGWTERQEKRDDKMVSYLKLMVEAVQRLSRTWIPYSSMTYLICLSRTCLSRTLWVIFTSSSISSSSISSLYSFSRSVSRPISSITRITRSSSISVVSPISIRKL